MRILATLAAVFALAGSLAAQSVQQMHSLVVARKNVSSACATTDTAIAHDELLEGFQTATTGFESSWTETVDEDSGASTITEYADSSALATNKPTGACDRALRVQTNLGNTNEDFVTWDRGSAIDLDTASTDIVLYIYIETGQPAGEATTIFDGTLNSAPSATEVFSVDLNNNAGTHQIRVRGATIGGYVNVTEDSWIRLDIHLNATAANSYFMINGGSNQAFTRGANDLRYLHIGSTVARSLADSHDIYYDLLCVNTP